MDQEEKQMGFEVDKNEKGKQESKGEGSQNNKELSKLFYLQWYKIEYVIMAAVLLYFAKLYIDLGYFLQDNKNRLNGLTKGYFGRDLDNTDYQWKSFREFIPITLSVAVLFIAVSNFIKCLKCNTTMNQIPQRIWYILFGVIQGFIAYDTGLIFYFILSFANFLVIKILKGVKGFPLILFGINFYLLIYNDQHSRNYEFPSGYDNWQERHKNASVEFPSLFNICILKIIAFGLDYHWAVSANKSDSKHKIEETQKSKTYKRKKTYDMSSNINKLDKKHQNLDEYNLFNYYSYLLYGPLYIAGPHISFNAWREQVRNPCKKYTWKQILIYTMRLLFQYVVLEWQNHFLYVNLFKFKHLNMYFYKEFTALQFFVHSMAYLAFIWLKFCVIWRTYRLWALLDGVDTYENMCRCIFVEYSVEYFWKSWHRSFNRWIIRYMYIPLGGNRFKFLNIFIVFTFVLMWHELKKSLFIWGWGFCGIFIIEILMRSYFNSEKFWFLKEYLAWKYVCIFVASFGTLLLIILDVIGFGIGWDKFKEMYDVIDKSTIFWFFWPLLMVFNLCGFKVRQLEENKGVFQRF